MSAAVLQVFVLRDGQLLATEVFADGMYRIGSSRDCDLVLADPSVSGSHALLVFQGGRVQVSDDGSEGGVLLNGERVEEASVQSSDDLRIGPFLLKTRLVAKKKPAAPGAAASVPPPVAAPRPPAPVAAPGPVAPRPPGPAPVGPPKAPAPAARPPGAPPAPGAPPVVRPAAPRPIAPPGAVPPGPPRPPGAPVPTASALPRVAPPPARPAAPRPPVAPPPIAAPPIAAPPIAAPPIAAPPIAAPPARPAMVRPPAPVPPPAQPRRITPPPIAISIEPPPPPEPLEPVAVHVPSPEVKPKPIGPSEPAPVVSPEVKSAPPPPPPPAEPPKAAPALAPAPAPSGTILDLVDPLTPTPAPVVAPLITPEPREKTDPLPPQRTPLTTIVTSLPANAVRHAPDRLQVRVLWGAHQVALKSFTRGESVVIGADERHALPAYGLLPSGTLEIARPEGDTWRVHGPAGADVAVRAGTSGAWLTPPGPGALTLGPATTVRIAHGRVAIELTRVTPPPMPRPTLQRFDLVFLSIFAVVAIGITSLVLSFPPLPKVRAKPDVQRAVQYVKSLSQKPKPPKVKEQPVPRPRSRPLAQAATLEAAKESIRAVDTVATATKGLDKLLSSLAVTLPSSKGGAKNSALALPSLGNLPPIPGTGAAAGMGPLDGPGGPVTKGRGVLSGVAGLGTGTAGAGTVGAIPVTIPKKPERVQGEIDRDAVAKVINDHVSEMRGCYERALLRDANLGAGKVTLEWTIGATGAVTEVATKTSTLKNPEVVSCLLDLLRGLQFPKPQGGVVIVSYPILFNSVGY